MHLDHPRSQITFEWARLIHSFLLNSIDKMSLEGATDSPNFRGFPFVNGYIHVIVASQETRSWMNDLIHRQYIEGANKPNGDILHRLAIQNRAFDFVQWQLTHNRATNGGRLLIFTVTEDIVQALRQVNFTLFFGLHIIRLSVLSERILSYLWQWWRFLTWHHFWSIRVKSFANLRPLKWGRDGK